mgnify:FL=1
MGHLSRFEPKVCGVFGFRAKGTAVIFPYGEVVLRRVECAKILLERDCPVTTVRRMKIHSEDDGFEVAAG